MHKSVKRITSARSKSFGKCLSLGMICNVFMLFIYSFFHCFGLVVHVVFFKPPINTDLFSITKAFAKGKPA